MVFSRDVVFYDADFKKEEDWESIADRVKKYHVMPQYPMRVVADGPNPNDRVQVYRPWTPTELYAMVNQLPKADKNPFSN